jgi:glycopeptide antibiotics resistance protein/uncharacterized RDD family membrane protein YckC
VGYEFVVEPALIAIAIGAVLSVLLVVPVIAVQYRQWGTLSLGRLVLILAFMLYLIAIPMYTLLPTGIDVAALCAEGGGGTVLLRPFRFVDDFRDVARTSSPREFVASSTVQQVVFNVLLFVPLGIFLRKLNRLPWWAVIAAGIGTTLLVEFTQLTGNWGLSPCAYRVFEVDDLILNAGGTVIGLLLAPVLDLWPGTQLDERDRVRVRPINRKRRLIQVFCDWMIFWIGSVVASLGVAFVLAALDMMSLGTPHSGINAVVEALVGVVLFVVIPLGTHGETLGEKIVLVSVKTTDGRDPGLGAVLLKSVSGWMPFVVLSALGTAGVAGMDLLSLGWIAFTLVYILRRPEGFSMAVSGLRRFDDRVALTSS